MANLGFSVRLQLINQQFKAGLREATQGLQRMRYRMLALASAFTGGGFALAGFIGKLKEVARETNRAGVMLENVAGKGHMYARSVGYLSNLSRRYKQDLNVLTESFAKMKAVSDSAGISIDAQEKMFSSFTRTITAFNLSNADARLAQLALQQMMSKGKISAEELRRQLGEKIPIAMAAMANAAGVPISQLDKLLKGGKLVSHEIMPKFAEELEKMTKNVNLDNIESSLNEQKNKLIEFAEWLHVKDIYKGLIDATIKAMDYLKKSFISLAATLAGIFAGIKMGGFAKKASIGLRQARNEAMALHKEASRALRVAKKDVKASKTVPAAVVRAESQEATSRAALQAADAKILASREAFAAKELALEQRRIAGRDAVLRAADAADLARAEKANAALLRATAARTRAQSQLDKANMAYTRTSGGTFLQRQAASERVDVAKARYQKSNVAYNTALANEQKAEKALGEGRIAAARAYDAETRKMQQARQAQQVRAEERLQSTRQANLARYDAARRASGAAYTAWDKRQEQAKHNVRMALQAKASARAAVVQAQAQASMPKFWASLRSRSVGFFGYLKGAVTFAGAHIRATGNVVLATLRAGLLKFGVMLRSVFSATIFAAVFGLVANIIGKIIEGVRETKRLKAAVDEFHKAVERAGNEIGQEGEHLKTLQRLLNDRNISEEMRLSIMNQINSVLRTQIDSEVGLNSAVERRLALLRAESRLRAAQERRTEAEKALLEIRDSAPKELQSLIDRIGMEKVVAFSQEMFQARLSHYDALGKIAKVGESYGLNNDEASALFRFAHGRGGFWNSLALAPTNVARIESNLAVQKTSEETQRKILNEELSPARKAETEYFKSELTSEFARIIAELKTGVITGEEAAKRKLEAEKNAVEKVKGVNENSTAGVAWAKEIEERHKKAAEEANTKEKKAKKTPTERIQEKYNEETLAIKNLRKNYPYKNEAWREELDKRENEAHGALIKELIEVQGANASNFKEYKQAVGAYKPEEATKAREYTKAREDYTKALRVQEEFLKAGIIDEKDYKNASADHLEAYLRRVVVLNDLTASEKAQLEADKATHVANMNERRGEKAVLKPMDTTFDYKKDPSELLAAYHQSLSKYQTQLEKWPNTSEERAQVKRDIEAIEEAMRRLEVEEDIDTYKKKITEIHRTALSGLIGAVRTLTHSLKSLWETLGNDNASALDRFFALFDLIVQMTTSVNQLVAAFARLDKVKTLLTNAEASEAALPSLSETVGSASEGTGSVIMAAKNSARGMGIGGGGDAQGDAEAIGERAAAIAAETAAIADKGAAVAETTAMIGAETAAIGLNTAATTAGGAVDTVVKATETANAEVETAAQMKLAGAKAGAAYAGIPFAGIAMAIGAITAIMGAIKMAKGFANGGLVDYGTTFGDTTPAFVNKGERILSRGNQEWLQGLAGRVRSDAAGGGRVEVTGRFELENNKLVAAVNKENQRWSR